MRRPCIRRILREEFLAVLEHSHRIHVSRQEHSHRLAPRLPLHPTANSVRTTIISDVPVFQNAGVLDAKPQLPPTGGNAWIDHNRSLNIRGNPQQGLADRRGVVFRRILRIFGGRVLGVVARGEKAEIITLAEKAGPAA